MEEGDWERMAISPPSETTTFGPIPHPISTFSRPLTSTRLFPPESVFVSISDFSFARQLSTRGASALCYLSRRTN